MNFTNINHHYQDVKQRILRTHRRYYLFRILASFLHFSLLFFLYLAFLLLLNFLFSVSIGIRLASFIVFLIGFIIFFILKIYPSLKEIIHPSQLKIFLSARELGTVDPTIQDAIVNYLQIYQDKSNPGSPIIRKLALEQLYQKITGFSFNDHRLSRKIIPKIRLVLLTIVIYSTATFIFPDAIGRALKKIAIPWKNFTDPFPVSLHNESGYIKILKNEAAILSGYFQGTSPDQLYLIIEVLPLTELSSTEKKVNKILIPSTVSEHFSYEIPHVTSSFDYYFAAELNQPKFRNKKALSEKGRVEVQERPSIRSLRVKVSPPAYANLKSVQFDPNTGEITALAGSRVSLSLEADKLLSSAKIVFSDSSDVTMEVNGHTAHSSFNINKNLNYSIHIIDQNSIPNSDPVVYGIYIIPDEIPYAEFKLPAADVDLQDNLTIQVVIDLKDDFGFSKLWLKGKIFRQESAGDSSTFQMKIPYRLLEKGRAVSEFIWDLTPFYLVPDDYIQYYSQVFDNDVIRGPKSFSTPTYTIRLPSLLEILSRSENHQQEQLDKIEDLARESEDLRKTLEEINRELKKETQLNWEQQQEIKKQLNRQKEIANNLSQIQKDIESLIQEMGEKDVLSRETLEKYFELQKMFREMLPPEIQEALKNVQQALEKMDISQLQHALEKFQFSVQQFENSINRMYELFKQLQVEQKLDQLTKIAEQLNRDQTKVNEKLKETGLTEENYQRMNQMEKNIAQNYDYLADKLKQAVEELQASMNPASEILEQTDKFMEEQDISSQLMQMQKFLSEKIQSSASRSGQRLKSNFEMMQSMLQKAKQDMLQAQKDEISSMMQKTIMDMLETSFTQENLSKRTENLNSASPQINDLARQQSRLISNIDQIISQVIDISHRTFFVPSELNQSLSQVLTNMGQAVTQLENRNPRPASSHQKNAMSGLNQSLLAMQNSMNQLSQSSSASGIEQFLEQLQKMSGMQGQLNQESMSLFQVGQQGRMQLSSEDLARLAAQQGMIKNSLDQLTSETGNRRDVLGRLNELGDEMAEVIRQLEAQQLDRRVIERQERILSRLLDAQKSVREKDYSKKREAERETTQLVKSPPELRKETLMKEDRLRKELMNALEEGYSAEYRELIKYYFEYLSRQSNQIEQ